MQLFYLKYRVKPFFDAQILLFATKSLQTRFVAPYKPSIDTSLVIKVIFSNDKFIAIYTMKKFGARFSFSDFHGQKFSQQQKPGLREKITKNMINI